MTAIITQSRCEAVTEGYRGRNRCAQKAVGTFQRTRHRYADEPGKGDITIPLGKLCRRHAKAFGAVAIPEN